MNIRIILSYVGHILRLEAILMVPALIISLVKSESSSAIAFVFTMAFVFIVGQIMIMIKPVKRDIYAREGFAIVAFSWFFMSLCGGLPFYLSGKIPSFIDCFFETVSGFTTTGASILREVESLPMGLGYWRCFLCWIGGMGVLVFIMAVLPAKRGEGGSLMILRAESPGPQPGKLVPKMIKTARLLYIIYLALTVLQIILTVLGGMPLFDAICHSFSTAGTGGFSVKNASIGAYNSAYLEIVIATFMLLFGINFNVYYLILMKQFRSAFKNEELRAYLGIVAFSVIVIAVNTFSIFNHTFTALRHSYFQVASIITTTGFSSTDFDIWPEYSRSFLVMLMMIGACAGSTGGGIKVARIVMLMKSFRVNIQKLIHPRSVKVVKMDGNVIDKATLDGVNVYLTVYIMIFAASISVVAIDNFDLVTTFSAVAACFNNIGPGLSMVGAAGNYSGFSDLSKLVLSFDMLLGRLEIFPILMMFVPAAWKKAR